MKRKPVLLELLVSLLLLALYLCGVALIVYGLGMIYKPLSYIAMGVVNLSVGRAIVKTKSDVSGRKGEHK